MFLIKHDNFPIYPGEKKVTKMRFSVCTTLCSFFMGMFDSIVVVVFQITFHAEMHVNDIFFIFKKLFLISVYQNDPKHINHIKF